MHRLRLRTAFSSKTKTVGFVLGVVLLLFPFCIGPLIRNWPAPSPTRAFKFAFREQPPDFISDLDIKEYGKHFKGQWFLLDFKVPPRRIEDIPRLGSGYRIHREFFPSDDVWAERKFAELASEELREAADLRCTKWGEGDFETTCFYSVMVGEVFVGYYQDGDFDR